MMTQVRKANIFVTLREYGKMGIELDEALDIAENEYVQGNFTVRKADQSYIVCANVSCIPYPYDYFRAFAEENALEFVFLLGGEPFQALAIRKSDPFWAKPAFFSDTQGKTCKHIQQLLLKMKEKYVHIMPLTTENTVGEMIYDNEEKQIKICSNSFQGSLTALEGPLFIISEASNPYEAVENSYVTARKTGLIKTPLRTEKKYPEQLEGLGWCTWNAFYHEVTEDGIRAKLQELREKGIRLDWLIIDDGWSRFKEFKLQSFEEDRRKFPSGLKAFIASIKREYGVRYVGVWHAFTGYWFGVDKESQLYTQQKGNLEETSAGLVVPAGEYEKAYAFYHTWHQYLADQGVDFLKVDTQGNALEFLRGTRDAVKKVAVLHEALEQSVQDCFGGAMIDCMGMDNLDGFNRKYSSVLRSSGDFFPDKEDGFRSHIEQNSYNAVFCNQLYYCDFDMWWTKHFQAKQSCALRKISGGPIYVSDKVGDTQTEYLKQLVNEDGSVTRYENAARPTVDCLFGYDKVLKLFNKQGSTYMIAVFNLSEEDVTTTVTKADLGLMGDGGVNVTVKAGDVEFVRLFD